MKLFKYSILLNEENAWVNKIGVILSDNKNTAKDIIRRSYPERLMSPFDTSTWGDAIVIEEIEIIKDKTIEIFCNT